MSNYGYNKFFEIKSSSFVDWIIESIVTSIIDVEAKCIWWQVSYGILEKVSPVTHSVGNCVKRVVVIVSSVIFFQTPVSPVNAFGKSLSWSTCSQMLTN